MRHGVKMKVDHSRTEGGRVRKSAPCRCGHPRGDHALICLDDACDCRRFVFNPRARSVSPKAAMFAEMHP